MRTFSGPALATFPCLHFQPRPKKKCGACERQTFVRNQDWVCGADQVEYGIYWDRGRMMM